MLAFDFPLKLELGKQRYVRDGGYLFPFPFIPFEVPVFVAFCGEVAASVVDGLFEALALITLNTTFLFGAFAAIVVGSGWS